MRALCVQEPQLGWISCVHTRAHTCAHTHTSHGHALTCSVVVISTVIRVVYYTLNPTSFQGYCLSSHRYYPVVRDDLFNWSGSQTSETAWLTGTCQSRTHCILYRRRGRHRIPSAVTGAHCAALSRETLPSARHAKLDGGVLDVSGL